MAPRSHAWPHIEHEPFDSIDVIALSTKSIHTGSLFISAPPDSSSRCAARASRSLVGIAQRVLEVVALGDPLGLPLVQPLDLGLVRLLVGEVPAAVPLDLGVAALLGADVLARLLVRRLLRLLLLEARLPDLVELPPQLLVLEELEDQVGLADDVVQLRRPRATTSSSVFLASSAASFFAITFDCWSEWRSAFSISSL